LLLHFRASPLRPPRLQCGDQVSAERVKDQFPASILVQKTGRRRSTATLV